MNPTHGPAAPEPPRHDPVLAPFLAAGAEADADAHLGQLLSAAAPTVRAVLSRRLGVTLRPDWSREVGFRELDGQDLCQETLAALAARLRRLRVVGRPPVADFRAYAAAAALNAWRSAVRRDARPWARLSGQLTYLCRGSAGQTGLAKWTHGGAGAVAGFTLWRTRPPVAFPSGADGLPAPDHLRAADVPLAEVAAWVLDQAGGPLSWNDFVGAVAEVRGGAALTLVSLEQLASTADPPAPPAPAGPDGPEGGSPDHERLRQTWEELGRLPRAERLVLLLKAEDLLDFELTGVARLPEIAAALEMAPWQLAEWLPRLPLDDQEIGRLLGGRSPQAVANLRVRARATLRRRLPVGPAGAASAGGLAPR